MIETEEKKIHYSFKKGKHSGETFQASYKVCHSPTCTCCDIDLKFESKNDQMISPALEVSLNVLRKSISEKTKRDANRQFAKSLVKDFDTSDWKILRDLFLIKKTYYTENSDLKDLDLLFPMDEIETEGLLISFNEILPFARRIIFEISGITFIVDDLYCVYPQCPCQDIHLFFTPYHEDQSIFPFMTESTGETYIIYNVKSNRWHLQEKTEIPISPKQLMTTLKNAYDIQKLYGDRQKTIRRLYLNYRRQHFQSFMPSQTVRIGRNDPCPCGSGKKYKETKMLFHEKYLDVLQNIEFGIVQIYRKYPDLHDYDVMNALEALIDFYVAQMINRNPRDFFLSDRVVLVFENVKKFCEWRLGRKSIEIKGDEIDKIEMEPKTLDEIINCLKKILNSVKKWNKRGGKQGYLSFISSFIR